MSKDEQAAADKKERQSGGEIGQHQDGGHQRNQEPIMNRTPELSKYQR